MAVTNRVACLLFLILTLILGSSVFLEYFAFDIWYTYNCVLLFCLIFNISFVYSLWTGQRSVCWVPESSFASILKWSGRRATTCRWEQSWESMTAGTPGGRFGSMGVILNLDVVSLPEAVRRAGASKCVWRNLEIPVVWVQNWILCSWGHFASWERCHCEEHEFIVCNLTSDLPHKCFSRATIISKECFSDWYYL